VNLSTRLLASNPSAVCLFLRFPSNAIHLQKLKLALFIPDDEARSVKTEVERECRNKSAGIRLSTQRRRTDEIKRCGRSQGDAFMNRIQRPFTIAKHRHSAAALFAVVLALAGFANADAMSSAHSHKGKKGNLKITAPTEVGGTILQPGDYEVKEVNSPSGSVVEFVHLFDNFTAPEGLPVHDQEVVARVKFTGQALSSLPNRTQLQLASNTANAIALEIRGDDVEYLFGPTQLTGQADSTEVCTNAELRE
jgi:hypothetical protein